MNMQDIRKKAKETGINPNKMNKADLIRAIQRAEGNIDCFPTARVEHCEEFACLWRADCISGKGNKG